MTPQVPSATAYVRAVVDAARRGGVECIGRHSMHDAPHGRDALSRWHREAEAIVASSGLAYTVLRPNAFMQNFVTIYAPTIREQGFFRLPLGTARLSSVDTRDVAAAAAAILLTGGHDGSAYVLTGPEALTGEGLATTVTAVIGRPVRYVDEPEDAGKLAAVSGDVERLIGGPPASFARFAGDHRSAWA